VGVTVTAVAAPQLVIVTGMSGAGRSTAAHCLEDLGWFVVDNLPPSLLSTMVDLTRASGGAVDRVAVVLDVRSHGFFSDLRTTLEDLRVRRLRPRVMFLEASTEELVRRFESARRPHPLAGRSGGMLVDEIDQERDLLRELRAEADLVIDTSGLNVHELRSKVTDAFADAGRTTLRATLVSFGYKYGLPLDADLVADCRFLPNPHWVPSLRPFTGRDPDVRSYVLDQPLAGDFLDTYEQLLGTLMTGYRTEGKQFLTLALGCTGGKHRSVAIAEELARRLRAGGVDVTVIHRDMGRE
jgi:UPF0042 nucleotide-binding protein